MTRVGGLLLLAVVCTLGGCGQGNPEPPHDPPMPARNAVVFEMEPVMVGAGKESMYCHYLPPLESDLVVRGFSTRQSEGGHHLVIYRAIEQKPAGTIEDCSTGESMTNLMLVLTQTGTQEPGASAIEFPDKHVTVLKAGLQLVAQSHYINTSDTPRESKDELTVFTTDADLATLTQLHLFLVTSISFQIPPRTQSYSVSAGCEALDKNVKLLSLVPHMHEWGIRIDLHAGDADAMQPVMEVPEWTADMRDLPPVSSFNGTAAPANGQLSIGQKVALTCTWRNMDDHPIGFPAEMCAAVGYFTSEDPNATDVTCLSALPTQR